MGSGIKGRFIKIRVHNDSDKLEKESQECMKRKREEELIRQELEANDPFVKNGEETAVLAWKGY